MTEKKTLPRLNLPEGLGLDTLAVREGLPPSIGHGRIQDGLVGDPVEQVGVVERPSPLLLEVGHGLQLGDSESPRHEVPAGVKLGRLPPEHEVCLLEDVLRVGRPPDERADKPVQRPLGFGHLGKKLS